MRALFVVGQKVAIMPHTFNVDRQQVIPATVTRVTKMRVSVDNGQQFTPSGRRVGDADSWTPTRLVLWNDQVQALYERYQVNKRKHVLASALDRVIWRDLPLADLHHIADYLAERGVIRRPHGEDE